MTTPNLGLSELAASQAQPHLTVNSSLRSLDAMVQLTVTSILATPPSSPADGDRYIVGTGATGVWSGHDDSVACFVGSAWAFYVPLVGWLAFVQSSSSYYSYGSGSPPTWEVLQTGGAAAAGPDSPPSQANAFDDEFDDGSDIDLTKWTLWSGVSNGTAAHRSVGTGAFVCRSGDNNGTLRQAYVQNVSDSAWSLRARFRMVRNITNGADIYKNAWDGTGQFIGLICGQSSNNKNVGASLQIYGTDTFRVRLMYYNGTTYSSGAGYWGEPNMFKSIQLATSGFYLQMNYNAGAISCTFSPSGISQTYLLASGAVAGAFLTDAADRFGFYVDNSGSTADIIYICDWIRRVA